MKLRLLSALFVLMVWTGLGARDKSKAPPPTPPPPPAALQEQGSSVLIDGEEVFQIKAPVGPFSAESRATAASRRLQEVHSNPFAAAPTLTVVDDGVNANVMAGDAILFSTTPDDAKLAGVDRLVLAQGRADRVQVVLGKHTWWNRAKSLALGIGLSLLITLGVWYGYRLLRWGFAKVETRVLGTTGRWLNATHSNRLKWLPVEHLNTGVKFLFNGARLVIYGVVAYLYLSVVFSFFPWTKGLASRLFAFAWNPLMAMADEVFAYLPKLFFLVIIILVTRYLLKLISLAFSGIREGTLRFEKFHPEWADPTYKLVRILVLAFALVIAFPYLPGSQSDAFKGVSLFVGVLFSLGSSGAVGNMVAGVLITYMRPFKIGDRIQVGDTIGDVIERTALVTRIRTIKNVDVTVPNSTILSSQVHNYSANAKDLGLILHTTVTIGYDAPWKTVHALLIDAALATEGILDNPKPFVFQTSLDDFYVSYQINAYTDQANQMAAIYAALHANIQEKFNEGGVEILSPHYAQHRDGNMTSIPASYLPSDYVAPSFRIQQISSDKGK